MTGAEPVGWANTALPLLVLVALAVGLPAMLVPRGTLSQAALAGGIGVSAALILLAGALILGLAHAARGAQVWAAMRAEPLRTADLLLGRSAMAALLWGPILGLVWLIRAQGVEARRGEARAREGRAE